MRARLAGLCVALLAPALLLGRWLSAAGEPLEMPGPLLPSAVGGWTATRDETLAGDVLEMIEPDAYLMRLYEAEGRTPVWVYVGFYTGRAGSGKSAHVPEACYPAQGWEILGSRELRLGLDGGEVLVAHMLDFHRHADREAVLYWFQPARRWPTGGAGEQLLHVLDAMRGQPQYAFVRISGPAPPEAGADAAERDLEDFAARLAPEVRRLVESLRPRRT